MLHSVAVTPSRNARSRGLPPAARSVLDLRGRPGFVYGRQSLVINEDDRSTMTQADKGTRVFERLGVVLAHAPFIDPDRSASTFAKKDRPEWDEMVRLIESGAIDGGVVWLREISRGMRRLKIFDEFTELLIAHHAQLVQDEQFCDLTEGDTLTLLGVSAVFAAAESRKISTRTRTGHEASAVAGRAPAGPPLFGYLRQGERQSRAWVLDETVLPSGETRPEIVREIFERFEAGEGTSRISNDLNRRGIASQRGGRWCPATVRQMLRNGAYVGRRVRSTSAGRGYLADVRGQWPPILAGDEGAELYDRVQLVLDGQRRGDRPDRAWLLTGVLRCEVCGGGVVTQAPNGRRDLMRYVCRSRYNVTTDGRPTTSCGVSIAVAAADRYVVPIITAWLSDPRTVAAIEAEDTRPEMARLRADRARCELDKARANGDQADGRLPYGDWLDQIHRLNARLSKIDEEIKALASPHDLAPEIGPDATERWELHTLDERAGIVSSVASLTLRRCRPDITTGGRLIIPAHLRVEWAWNRGNPITLDGHPRIPLPPLTPELYAELDARHAADRVEHAG